MICDEDVVVSRLCHMAVFYIKMFTSNSHLAGNAVYVGVLFFWINFLL